RRKPGSFEDAVAEFVGDDEVVRLAGPARESVDELLRPPRLAVDRRVSGIAQQGDLTGDQTEPPSELRDIYTRAGHPAQLRAGGPEPAGLPDEASPGSLQPRGLRQRLIGPGGLDPFLRLALGLADWLDPRPVFGLRPLEGCRSRRHDQRNREKEGD